MKWTGYGPVQDISIQSKSRGGLQMDRKLLVVVFCAMAVLTAAASAAFGQEAQKAKPQLQIRHATKAARTLTLKR
jgi:hypothetical protein